MSARYSIATLVVLFGLLGAKSTLAQTYRYRLESGKQVRVCQHMARIYASQFANPWEFTLERPPGPSYPPLPRATGKITSGQLVGVLLSRYPASPEFEAINWQVGRYLANAPELKGPQPILLARFDIDNDGKDDVVAKVGFMFSPEPAGQGAPGGNDGLFVFNENEVPWDRPLTPTDLYGHAGSTRPSMISAMTMHMSARSIRPFIYDGQTYLSVYEAENYFDEKQRKEQMWVMKYKGGGENLGGGHWRPLNVEKICRFRMFASYR